MKFVRMLIWSAVSLSLLASAWAQKSHFDLRDPLIPAEEIVAGGPPKDGIPAIDEPRFVSAREARFLRNDDRVLALERNGVAKAYPIRILNWHEVVNDRFAGEPIVVTWCPLCGSGMVFRGESRDRPLTFGVSGLLYNSDVLLYDRQTESLWSQIMGAAVTGPMKGARLHLVPAIHTTWGEWRRRQPNSLVLSTVTGHVRDYARDPYLGYERSDRLMFPVRFKSEGFHPKERVLGVAIGQTAKAYPFVELGKRAAAAEGPLTIDDIIEGHRVRIRFDPAHETAEAFDATGEPLAATTLFWFAWFAFHPETLVYRSP
jgi:hypothetical protein